MARCCLFLLYSRGLSPSYEEKEEENRVGEEYPTDSAISTMLLLLLESICFALSILISLIFHPGETPYISWHMRVSCDLEQFIAEQSLATVHS